METDRLKRLLARLSVFTAADGWLPKVVRDFASSRTAAVIHGDMGGYVLVTPQLEFFDWTEDYGEVRPLTDERWRVIALVTAADQHSELAPLLPTRPDEATDCAACTGTGRHQVAEFRLFCAECLGLGWRGP